MAYFIYYTIWFFYTEIFLNLQPEFMDCVAQLVRASDCGSEGRGFEPHHGPLNS